MSSNSGNTNTLSRLKRLLKRKRSENPVQYKKAEENGKLMELLADELNELMTIGIDPKRLQKIDLSRMGKNLDGELQVVSDLLDERVFEPFYSSKAGDFEKFVSSKLVDYRAVEDLEDVLRFPKIALVGTSAILALTAVSQLARKNVPSFLFCAFASADCLRASYNCYINNYCTLATARMMKDPLKVGSTLFSWAQKAFGMIGVDDPLSQLKKEVNWEILLDQTFTIKVITMVKEFLKNKK